jgi:hypothetical protein
MSLSSWPTELLCEIWKHIHRKKDLSALVQVDRRFYRTFHRWLYCFDREHCGSSALFWAAARNRTLTAQASLEERANIPDDGDCLQVALQIGVTRCSCVVIELLLKQGVDLDLQTALQISVEHGSCAVVKLLLEKTSVDLNAPVPCYGHLLQLASWLGDQEVMELLLEKGAKVNALGGYYGSALQAASWAGSWANNDKMVKLLLSYGADVNAQGGYFGNALQAACWGRDMSIVKLLLRAGADVCKRSGRFGDAKRAASSGGHKRIEGLLLYWHWRQCLGGMRHGVCMS